jgi:phospholipase C
MRLILIFSCLFFYSLLSFSQKKDTIAIVTWNIYMRPRMVMHDDQIERAKEIVNAVLNDTMDIIVFEEIFDRKARNIIAKGLHSVYPYSVGPGKGGFLKLSSGVMILSKYPIEGSSIVYFNTCKKADCLARKAVVCTSIRLNDQKKINLLGTHLQAIEGEDYRKIRSRQIDIMRKTAEANQQKQIPIIYAGDFNISTSDTLFQKLISSFDTEQSVLISTRKYSSDIDNNYKQGDTGESLIDHIFLSKNNSQSSIEQYEVVRKTYSVSDKKKDLSDHYLVKAKLIF